MNFWKNMVSSVMENVDQMIENYKKLHRWRKSGRRIEYVLSE